MSVFNAKLISVVEQNLYTLKRLYGGEVVLCSLLDASTDYQTGLKTIQYSTTHVRRAIVLPSRVTRDVVLSVARISSNKPLAYGGEFDAGDRGFIISGKDIPGLEVKKDDWLAHRGERYSVKTVMKVCGDIGWMIVARRLPGVPLTFDVRANSAIHINSEASNE
jgi:hypothetical protein